MVVIRRVTTEKADDSNPDNLYSLIDIHFETPTETPQTEPISARPYMFTDDGMPTQYATSCPHCGEGNFPKVEEHWDNPDDALVHKVGDNYFAHCTECGAGQESSEPDFEDPFQNPIKDNKISTADLDPDLEQSAVDTSKTIAEKMQLSEATEKPPETQESEKSSEPDGAQEDEGEGKETQGVDDALPDLDDEARNLLNMLEQDDDDV